MSLILGRVAQNDFSVCNTESTWIPSYKYEESRYERNLLDPQRRYILELNGHIPNNMTYRINNYGFRGDDWEIGTDCDVCIGSSNTWGGGNYEENIYPTLIAKETGRTVYNLGYPAGTADGTFRYATYWLPILKPKTVYSCWPGNTRSELITTIGDNDEKIHKHISWEEHKRKSGRWPTTEEHYRGWFENPENSMLNNLKNLMATKELCDNIGAEFIVTRPTFITIDDLSEEFQSQECYSISQGGGWPIGDIARDIKHRGAEFQRVLAQRLLDINEYDWVITELKENIFGEEAYTDYE